MSKQPAKWLDLRKLCENLLPPIGKALGERAELAAVHYFSAYAFHRTPHDRAVVDRHATYVAALQSTGVRVVMSRFKNKEMHCPLCNRVYLRPEEKETDVAMAMKLLEVFTVGEASTAVLVAGDTDLLPAIATARRLFPQRGIGIVTPFLRHTTQMQTAGDFHFGISQRMVQSAQFPTVITLPDGGELTRPAGW
jgi:uncharacterized LabA/DUF88 family protein